MRCRSIRFKINFINSRIFFIVVSVNAFFSLHILVGVLTGQCCILFSIQIFSLIVFSFVQFLFWFYLCFFVYIIKQASNSRKWFAVTNSMDILCLVRFEPRDEFLMVVVVFVAHVLIDNVYLLLNIIVIYLWLNLTSYCHVYLCMNHNILLLFFHTGKVPNSHSI